MKPKKARVWYIRYFPGFKDHLVCKKLKDAKRDMPSFGQVIKVVEVTKRKRKRGSK